MIASMSSVWRFSHLYYLYLHILISETPSFGNWLGWLPCGSRSGQEALQGDGGFTTKPFFGIKKYMIWNFLFFLKDWFCLIIVHTTAAIDRCWHTGYGSIMILIQFYNIFNKIYFHVPEYRTIIESIRHIPHVKFFQASAKEIDWEKKEVVCQRWAIVPVLLVPTQIFRLFFFVVFFVLNKVIFFSLRFNLFSFIVI